MTAPNTPFTVKALFEYLSGYDDDLLFSPGQIITVTDVEDDEWYSGTYDGKSGMFPKNFVEIVPAPHAPSSRPHRSPAKTADEAALAVEEPKTAVPVAKPEVPEPQTVPEESIEPKTTSTEPSKPLISSTASKASIFAAEGLKVPLPGQKIADPYGVQKQFLATAKSSYVPQIQPRDTSSIPKRVSDDVPADREIARENDRPNEDESAANEPKLSLKERIALLQKRQQEEAEREAAAVKKREERKQKAAEEKERQKQKREADAHSIPETGLARHLTGDTLRSMETDALQEETDEPVAHEEPILDEEEEPEEEQEAPSEDAPEESDDEELKRRKLVERMAKISGGRNMFGMMGMQAPFGAPAPAASKLKTKNIETEVEKTEKAPVSPVVPSAHSPTISPILPSKGEDNDSKNLDSVLKDAEDSSDDDENDDFADASPVSPAGHRIPPSPTTRATPPPIPEVSRPLKESSSMAESDDFIEPDRDEVGDENEDSHVYRNLPSVPLESVTAVRRTVSRGETLDTIHGHHHADNDLKLDKGLQLDTEATGYEADEDLSDRVRAPALNVDNFTTSEKTISNDFQIPPPPPSSEKTSEPQTPGVLTRENTQNAPTLLPPMPPVPVPQTQKAPPIPVPHSGMAPPVPHHAPVPLGHPHGQPPPIPTGFPPAPEAPIAEEFLTSEDEQFSPQAPSRAFTVPTSFPPVPLAPPVPPPGAEEDREAPSIDTSGLRRTSTDISGVSKSPTLQKTSTGSSLKRRSSESTRSRGGRAEVQQADSSLPLLDQDLADILTSSWWLKGELPESLVAKIGSDLVYEVDQHQISKRGGRTIYYKDYYILFHDLSQLVLEVEYEGQDPRSTVKVANHFVKPAPIIRKDLLDRFHHEFGLAVVTIALSLLGTKLNLDLVATVLKKLQTQTEVPILGRIGDKLYGINIYKNVNNTNVSKVDDIRAGDILCIKSGKFAGHKSGLAALGPNKSLVVGDGTEIFSAVIVEYDNKKEKFRVLESDGSGMVKKESYKLGDMKSGRVRVYRVVSRDYVGW